MGLKHAQDAFQVLKYLSPREQALLMVLAHDTNDKRLEWVHNREHGAWMR